MDQVNEFGLRYPCESKNPVPKPKHVEEEIEDSKKQLISKIHIERMVLLGRCNQDLQNTKFVFASFNYFVKDQSLKIRYPAEFSACEFSLNSGVKSVYSTMINPGKLSLGQAFGAQQHSSCTHQLPLPPNAEGESNMSKLYRAILAYTGRIGDGKALVVLASTNQIPVVKECFDYLKSAAQLDVTHDDDDEEDKDPIPSILVYDIQYLFFILKKEIMGMVGKPNNHQTINQNITDAIFLRDFFEFEEGIACPYHEELDRSRYCTRSQVIRWAYTFCDYMCKDLGITMEPGKHSPIIVPPSTSSD